MYWLFFYICVMLKWLHKTERKLKCSRKISKTKHFSVLNVVHPLYLMQKIKSITSKKDTRLPKDVLSAEQIAKRTTHAVAAGQEAAHVATDLCLT